MFTVQSLPDAVAEHYEYIRRTAYRMTHDLENLEDYAQSAYVACIQRVSKCDLSRDGSSFRQYCAQTTVFTVRTIRKAQLRERQKLADNAILGDMFAALPDRDRSKALRAAFKLVSATSRKTLRAHFRGQPVCKMALSRARKDLMLRLA